MRKVLARMNRKILEIVQAFRSQVYDQVVRAVRECKQYPSIATWCVTTWSRLVYAVRLVICACQRYYTRYFLGQLILVSIVCGAVVFLGRIEVISGWHRLRFAIETLLCLLPVLYVIHVQRVSCMRVDEDLARRLLRLLWASLWASLVVMLVPLVVYSMWIVSLQVPALFRWMKLWAYFMMWFMSWWWVAAVLFCLDAPCGIREQLNACGGSFKATVRAVWWIAGSALLGLLARDVVGFVIRAYGPPPNIILRGAADIFLFVCLNGAMPVYVACVVQWYLVDRLAGSGACDNE